MASNIQQVSRSESLEVLIRNKKTKAKKRKTRFAHNGTILKLVPWDLEPMYNMDSPIQDVRILQFRFPVNCKIFQDGTARDQECFSWALDASKYKRGVATKYYKEEEYFSITNENKNCDEEALFGLESKEAKYYFDWIYSQGNKDGLLLIDAIKSMAHFFKKLNKLPITIDVIQELKLRNLYYFKKPNSTTLEWIKTQPYLTRFNKITEDETLSLTEECFSNSYLELMGLDTNNTDKIHSLLKKSKISAISTNDFLGSYTFVEVCSKEYGDSRYEKYINCGLERPFCILQNRSILIKSLESGEELYKGHFVVWDEVGTNLEQKFLKLYVVFIIDEKIKEEI